MKFYYCKKCGKIVTALSEGAGTLTCCGEAMEVLEAKEEFNAKHTPSIETMPDGRLAAYVGQERHPMEENHYIEWIYCVYPHRNHDRVFHLKPGDTPEAKLCDAHPTSYIYAYCNVHGLFVYRNPLGNK